MPRYNEEKDESYHAAASAENCLKMQKNQGWRLKGIKQIGTGDAIFKVDCIFHGETEFPKSFYDQENDLDGDSTDD
jgi:hypothetical protein